MLHYCSPSLPYVLNRTSLKRESWSSKGCLTTFVVSHPAVLAIFAPERKSKSEKMRRRSKGH